MTNTEALIDRNFELLRQRDALLAACRSMMDWSAIFAGVLNQLGNQVSPDGVFARDYDLARAAVAACKEPAP